MAEKEVTKNMGSKIRNIAENVIVSMAGAGAASRRSVVDESEEKKSVSKFIDWVKSSFPSLTRDDDRGFATLMETHLSPSERDSIATLRKSLKEGVRINGKIRRYDEEQWVMDVWLDAKDYERKLDKRDQQISASIPENKREHLRGIASLLARRFQPQQIRAVREFFNRLETEGIDANQLQIDLWLIFENHRNWKEEYNPAVVILGAIADNEGRYEIQKGRVADYGLLSSKEAASGEGNPTVRLLKELVALNNIEDQVRRLLSTGRLIEMTMGRSIVRNLARNPVAFAVVAGLTVINVLVTLSLIIYLLA